MPSSVPPAVSKSFAALIPAILTLTIFLIVRIIFTFTPWGNIHDFIFQIVQAPLTSLGKGIIPTIYSNICNSVTLVFRFARTNYSKFCIRPNMEYTFS